MTLEMLQLAVLKVLMATQVSWLDASEPTRARQLRLDRVAQHIASVATSRNDPGGPWATASVLLTLGMEETRWARYVGAGDCANPPTRPDGARASDCDAGKAHTYFQVWQIGCPKLKGLRLGSDAELTAATACAARIFWAGYRDCGNLSGGFSRYATGSTCDWSRAKGRRETLSDMGSALRAELLRLGAKTASR